MQVAVASGLTGADVARQILDRNGLQGVPVEVSPGGPLSDHYDPRKKSVHLSEPVYGGRAVASTAIAAHEVGHAIQHAKAYGPFRLRSAMWPAVAFASNAWLILLLIGAFAQLFGLVTFAVILYAVVVLFQIVTLPVEFDASRRAMAQLNDIGPRLARRGAGSPQGAHRRRDDLRRRRARCALAARVLRAGLPRQPELTAQARAGHRADRACRRSRRPERRSCSRCSSTAPSSRRPSAPPSSTVAPPAPRPRPEQVPEQPPTPVPITITATGDIAFGAAPEPPARRRSRLLLRRPGRPRGRRRARQPRGHARRQRRRAVRRTRGLPPLPRPDAYATRLGDAGFTVVSLANDHAYDFGEPGLRQTVDALSAAGVGHTGRRGQVSVQPVGSVGRRARRIRPDPLVGLGDRHRRGEAPRPPRGPHGRRRRRRHARRRRGRRAHSTSAWATSATSAANRGDVVRFAHAVVDAGADLVVGHGPRVLRGMEWYKGRLIAYSLGNAGRLRGRAARRPALDRARSSA